MDTAAFIKRLIATDPTKAGYIPPDAVDANWVRTNNLIIPRDARNRQIGFLLHGPVQPGEPVTINRIQIEPAHQRQGHGRAAIQKLIARGSSIGALRLEVRCPAGSRANFFFLAIGFKLIARDHAATPAKPTTLLYTYPLLDGHQETRTPHSF